MGAEPVLRSARPPVGAPTRCAAATTSAELAEHLAVRHEVFVGEQRLFDGTDEDAVDALVGTVHVLGRVADQGAGAVRLYPIDGTDGMTGWWQGDRLAVRRGYRSHGLGAPLVRYAVATAGALGGRVMVAHVQVANVVFFTHLGWQPVGPTEIYVGQPHQRMTIELPDPATGARLVRRLEGLEGEVSGATR